MVAIEDIVIILLATAMVLVSVIGFRGGSVNRLEGLANVALLAETPLFLFLVIGEVFGIVPTGYVLGSLVAVFVTVLVGAAAYIHGKYVVGVA